MDKIVGFFLFILTASGCGTKIILDDLEYEATPLLHVEQHRNIRKTESFKETEQQWKAPYFTNVERMSKKKSQVKPEGGMISLKCKSEGYPTPSTTWYKNNGTIIRELGDVRYHRWSLYIEDLTTSDSGNYTCVVCNRLGCIDYNFTVEVVERVVHRPIITEGPHNITADVGHSVSFNCSFISDVHVYIYWIKGLPETSRQLDVIIKTEDPSISENPLTLELHNVTHESEGWYTCMVANALGTSYVSGYLEVHIDNALKDNVNEII